MRSCTRWRHGSKRCSGVPGSLSSIRCDKHTGGKSQPAVSHPARARQRAPRLSESAVVNREGSLDACSGTAAAATTDGASIEVTGTVAVNVASAAGAAATVRGRCFRSAVMVTVLKIRHGQRT